ncbi:FAD binding domain-containing protein [Sorangium sp. So ce131]|uniref:FAD binding domain-containing protein n=1 Tax=Sorangium sp. So ce131 TaxID=3133282 RepID=UPI003F5DABAC
MSLADLPLLEMRRVSGLGALCELVAEQAARGAPVALLAGGTDWVVEQELRPPLDVVAQGAAGPTADAGPGSPPLVIDVSRLADLRGISLAGDTLRVGAATTYLEMRRSDVILGRAPLLARMSRDVGAVQIQARGTLGGNLATASPAADGVAALAAYDATVVVQSVRGERRIPMSALQTGYKRTTRAPDEVIVAVEIALPEPGSPWYWRKIGARRAQAISKVALAAVAEVRAGRLSRLGLGMASVAPTTALLPHVRALCLSRPLAELTAAEVDAAVAQDISPIDDVRSTRAYREHCARGVVRELLRQLGAPV